MKESNGTQKAPLQEWVEFVRQLKSENSLSKESGVARGTLNDWKRGRIRNVGYGDERVGRLAKAIGVHAADLWHHPSDVQRQALALQIREDAERTPHEATRAAKLREMGAVFAGERAAAVWQGLDGRTTETGAVLVFGEGWRCNQSVR